MTHPLSVLEDEQSLRAAGSGELRALAYLLEPLDESLRLGDHPALPHLSGVDLVSHGKLGVDYYMSIFA